MLIHLQLDIIIFDQDVLNQQLQSKSMHAVSNVTTVWKFTQTLNLTESIYPHN